MGQNNLEERKRENGKKSPDERINDLLFAFEAFCEETSRLEQAYKTLQNEFMSVNQELQKANQELNRKVFKLNWLTNYLEDILSHMAQGLMFIKLDGTISTFNYAMEGILKVPQSKVIGRKFESIFPGSYLGFPMQEALLAKKAPLFSKISREVEGEDIYCEVEARFMLKNTEKGEIEEGLIILMRDITELKKLELVAQRGDRMKELGEMASQVAHEIRNPLGGIKGFASLLKRDLKEMPHQMQMAEQIIEGTDQLNELVSQVLDFSKPVRLHLKTTDLVNLIEEDINLIKYDSSINPKPEIKLEISDSKRPLELDEGLIKRALMNLLVNSCQAMPEGGRIILKVRYDLKQVVIQVIDTGKGISKENLEKVFLPFFTTKASGNGFGLPEVLKAVQAHGGSVDISSQENKGTVFTLILPQKTT